MEIRITHVIELSSSLMALLTAAAVADGVKVAAAPKAAPAPEAAPNAAPAADGPVAGDIAGAASSDDGTVDTTVDAAGWPWTESLHASTKGTTKDGLWRMKVGVSRPDPKPGFPKADGATGTTATGADTGASASAPSEPAGAADDDDEFAAFSAAAAKANGVDAAAAAAVPARKWADADLGALCNQAAVKLGDPAPVRALIAEFVTTGEVPHSRNIPDDKREAFAKAVEAKAGIEFAG